MGKPGPNDSMIPPTAETVANTIDSNDMANGWAVILAAAAVGVMSRLSTSTVSYTHLTLPTKA